MAERKTHLHAVETGPKPAPRRRTTTRKTAAKAATPPEPPKPKTVTQAARTGTTRELLEATRDRIALAVENPNTPPRDLAALTKRLMETVREIEAYDARESQEAGSHAEVGDADFDASAI
ncbi:hypothetical protein ACF1AJ_20500 [Leifsonia sp. NPDC014704]|uniref:hypothetical protein n=1 Tax=Leifsonia sp. NPDC014704 TaxID=3364123 RepID=UPI0036F47B31